VVLSRHAERLSGRRLLTEESLTTTDSFTSEPYPTDSAQPIAPTLPHSLPGLPPSVVDAGAEPLLDPCPLDCATTFDPTLPDYIDLTAVAAFARTLDSALPALAAADPAEIGNPLAYEPTSHSRERSQLPGAADPGAADPAGIGNPLALPAPVHDAASCERSQGLPAAAERADVGDRSALLLGPGHDVAPGECAAVALPPGARLPVLDTDPVGRANHVGTLHAVSALATRVESPVGAARVGVSVAEAVERLTLAATAAAELASVRRWSVEPALAESRRSVAAGGASAPVDIDPAAVATDAVSGDGESDGMLVDRVAASSGAVSGLADVVAAVRRALAVFPPAGVGAASDWDVLDLQGGGAVGRRSPASAEVVVAASARSSRLTVSITKPEQPGETGTARSRLAPSPVGTAAEQFLGGELTAAAGTTMTGRAIDGGVTPGRGVRPGRVGSGGDHGTGAESGSPPSGQDALAARIARTLRLVVDEWRWPVVPGAFVTRSGRCCCGDRACAEPGTHLVDPAAWVAATADPDRVREWWLACPLAAVMMPLGWHVDVIDAPENGAREALGRLEMMGYRPAPAISTGDGRLLFLVAAGARRIADGPPRGRARRRAPQPAPVLPTQTGPETALWLGGDGAGEPDIVIRRRGVLLLPPLGPEPPGAMRWLVEPDPVRRPLPRAEDVLGPLLHACRDVAARRRRRPSRLTDAATGLPGAAPAGSAPRTTTRSLATAARTTSRATSPIRRLPRTPARAGAAIPATTGLTRPVLTAAITGPHRPDNPPPRPPQAAPPAAIPPASAGPAPQASRPPAPGQPAEAGRGPGRADRPTEHPPSARSRPSGDGQPGRGSPPTHGPTGGGLTVPGPDSGHGDTLTVAIPRSGMPHGPRYPHSVLSVAVQPASEHPTASACAQRGGDVGVTVTLPHPPRPRPEVRSATGLCASAAEKATEIASPDAMPTARSISVDVSTPATDGGLLPAPRRMRTPAARTAQLADRQLSPTLSSDPPKPERATIPIAQLRFALHWRRRPAQPIALERDPARRLRPTAARSCRVPAAGPPAGAAADSMSPAPGAARIRHARPRAHAVGISRLAGRSARRPANAPPRTARPAGSRCASRRPTQAPPDCARTATGRFARPYGGRRDRYIVLTSPLSTQDIHRRARTTWKERPARVGLDSS
jgi:hypothetical protein